MNQNYNQNYTREQIDSILSIIKCCIKEGRFIISKNENRQENINFMKEYNLNSRKQKDLLLDINIEDFCYSLQNIKPGYEHEILYVFCPQVMLFNFDGIEELVDIYTKFNIIETESEKVVIIISFHKINKPVYYLFR